MHTTHTRKAMCIRIKVVTHSEKQLNKKGMVVKEIMHYEKCFHISVNFDVLLLLMYVNKYTKC